ncbi:hypothetical protein [Pseudomonas sp. SWRI99]|uniref:hypothetical protein n=1 Tax=Pseudomonas sp. SWRI99 TaxID=2745506 RepID=UPI001645F589|nr:hypothetical protein [Pseudomonas sp. SWRI99]MBC3779314.1 hypothetical protein [Pseudomonas sp. SWRI99]
MICRKVGGVKAQNFTGPQISLVANLLREQALNTKHSFNFDARTFLVYKIDNSGNKAATNVALVNSLSGVALVDGANKSVRVVGKEPVELGEIPPRSTKVVYFWTSDYYYSRGDNSFIKYSEGTVDIDAMVPLGGVYKHFHDYSFMYQLLIFAVAVSLLVVFVVDKFVGKGPAILAASEQGRKPKRRRRRSRPKTRPDSQSRN